MITDYKAETIGRRMFDRYINQLNRVLTTRFNYSDKLAYGFEMESLLTEMCCNGYSIGRTIETLHMLECAGTINLEPFRVQSNY